MFLPHDLAIPSLGIYSKQMTAYVHTKMYKKIFIIALIQSKQKTTHVHQIDKTTGILTMEYYSATEGNYYWYIKT